MKDTTIGVIIYTMLLFGALAVGMYVVTHPDCSMQAWLNMSGGC